MTETMLTLGVKLGNSIDWSNLAVLKRLDDLEDRGETTGSLAVADVRFNLIVTSAQIQRIGYPDSALSGQGFKRGSMPHVPIQ